jgi:hypothetical protein
MFRKRIFNVAKEVPAANDEPTTGKRAAGVLAVAGDDTPLTDTATAKGIVMSVFPPVRRAALVEALVFLVAIVGFNLAFGDGARYINTSLHPFWIIVLLISAQYGPIEGLTTALLASAFLIVGNLPEQSLYETMYEYILRVSLSPFLWIVTALVLGGIRARQIDEQKKLQEQLAKAEAASTAIVQSYKAIKQSKEHLELRLAEERRGVLTIYELAKSLETYDPIEAMAGVETLVRVALNPKKFSFFSWRSGVLALETSYGWEANDEFVERFNYNSPLVSEILNKNRILSITNEDDEKILDGQGMLAGPIIDERTGELVAMLKIEETGFADMGVRTLETLRIVCSWIARVYANIETYQDAVTKLQQAGSKGKKREYERGNNGGSRKRHGAK